LYIDEEEIAMDGKIGKLGGKRTFQVPISKLDLKNKQGVRYKKEERESVLFRESARNLVIKYTDKDASVSQLLQALVKSGPHEYTTSLTLDLSDCQDLTNANLIYLGTHLPSIFPNLRQFTYTDRYACTRTGLNNPNLTSYGYQHLIDALGQLTLLKEIDVSFTRQGAITKESLNSLAASIKCHTSLTKLSLSVGGSGAGSDTRPHLLDASINNLLNSLKRLSNLETLNLDFDNTRLSSENLSTLAANLKQLPQLESLNLNFADHHPYNDNNWAEVAASIAGLVKLKQLSLSVSPPLSSQSLSHLTAAISGLSTLLSLSCNFYYNQKRTNEDWSSIAKMVANLANLSKLELNLGETNLTDQACQELCHALSNLVNLTVLNLNLEATNLTDQAFQELFQGLPHLVKLTELCLNLGGPNFTDQAFHELCHAIQNITKLKSLTLDLNSAKKLTREGFLVFTDAMRNLQALNKLELDLAKCTHIFREVIHDLTTSISELKLLTKLKLNLEEIKLTDGILTKLGNAFKQLNDLKQLELILIGNNISSTAGLHELANNLPNLENLKILLPYMVGNYALCGLRELKNLKHELICKSPNIKNISDFTLQTTYALI
jgi:hypothetical protein